jgi:hypothetical protein
VSVSTEVIFYTQVASVIAFLIALFGLYRVLVRQKDSTIALLLENDRLLSIELEQLRIQLPDAIGESMARRSNAALEEIKGRGMDDAEKRKLVEQTTEKVQLESRRLLDESKRLLDEASKASLAVCGTVPPRAGVFNEKGVLEREENIGLSVQQAGKAEDVLADKDS